MQFGPKIDQSQNEKSLMICLTDIHRNGDYKKRLNFQISLMVVQLSVRLNDAASLSTN